MDIYNDRATRIRRNNNREDRLELPVFVSKQSEMLFPKNSDIDEGDLIEWTTPAGHHKHLRVTEVEFLNSPFGGDGDDELDHTKVVLTSVHAPRLTPIRRVSIEGLHDDVSSASAALFANEHYASAVFEAFKAIEARVKRVSGLDSSGKKLMSQAFGTTRPKIDVSRAAGRARTDELEGFNQIFMGSMQAIRDPRAHEAVEDDAVEALELLALASMLMRRLDIAETRVD